MKNRYSFLIAFILFLSGQFSLTAQITADSVPPGMFAVNPYIALSVNPCTSYDSTTLDINCDGNPDFRFILYKGITIVDGGNMLYIRLLNDSFEVCRDTGLWGRPHYYNAGDPLVCPSNSAWAGDSLIILGDYGCLGCMGPYSQSNVYIAFRKAGQVGWMNISFNLVDGGSCTLAITATVHEILSPCLGSGVEEAEWKNNFSVSPNPFSENTVLRTSEPMKNGTLVIYNSYGQVVRQEIKLTGSVVNVERGDLPQGIYFICLSDEGQTVSTRKVVVADN